MIVELKESLSWEKLLILCRELSNLTPTPVKFAIFHGDGPEHPYIILFRQRE